MYLLLCVILVCMQMEDTHSLRIARYGNNVVAAMGIAISLGNPHLAAQAAPTTKLAPGPDDNLSTRQKVIRASNDLLSNPILENIRINSQQDFVSSNGYYPITTLASHITIILIFPSKIIKTGLGKGQ